MERIKSLNEESKADAMRERLDYLLEHNAKWCCVLFCKDCSERRQAEELLTRVWRDETHE